MILLENLVGYVEKAVRYFKKGYQIGHQYGKIFRSISIIENKPIQHVLKEVKDMSIQQVLEKAEMSPDLKKFEVGKKEPPTDEDIEKYYKRYVAKFEADAAYEWDTEEMMTLEEYFVKAKDKDSPSKGWYFLFSSTSHCMIGSPFGDGPLIFM